jgi:hypothetical protein
MGQGHARGQYQAGVISSGRPSGQCCGARLSGTYIAARPSNVRFASDSGHQRISSDCAVRSSLALGNLQGFCIILITSGVAWNCDMTLDETLQRGDGMDLLVEVSDEALEAACNGSMQRSHVAVNVSSIAGVYDGCGEYEFRHSQPLRPANTSLSPPPSNALLT